MVGHFLSDLSQDFGQLFSTGDNYDLIIQAGEGQNMKEFSAHSLILSTRSKYFKTALSKEWAKKDNGIIIYKKPNISPEIIELILKYLYTGIINFDKQNGVQMLKLLIATDELNLQKLSDFIQTYLIDNQAEYLRNNPIEVLQTVFQYETCENLEKYLQKLSDSIQTYLINNQTEYLRNDPIKVLQTVFQCEACENLRKFCLDTICKNPKICFESPNFMSLEKDLLILLLKENDLEMEEIEIWEHILKWALARMSTQHNVDNVSQWASNNFEELEEILRDIIPHIRWFQIPSKMFWRKVNPFEPIFPKRLYKDIIGYYCDPDTPPTNVILPPRHNLSINSLIIDRDHLSIIASWIDKKEKSFYNIYSNIPYSVDLLYRASRDGFEAAKFHELCDNKGSTIMISKSKENGRLVGGYNPLSWNVYSSYVNNNGSWQSTSDSFLFTFTKKEEINSAFITRVQNNQLTFAVCYGSAYGPAFGNGWDLIIRHDKISTYGSSTYPNLNLGAEYMLEDYEVFQLRPLEEYY